MFTFFIEFIYETKGGHTLHGKMECLNLYEVGDLLHDVFEWCDGNGYSVTKVEITKVGKAEL